MPNKVAYCTSCDSGNERSFNGSHCLCNAGFFDDGSAELCDDCHFSW